MWRENRLRLENNLADIYGSCILVVWTGTSPGFSFEKNTNRQFLIVDNSNLTLCFVHCILILFFIFNQFFGFWWGEGVGWKFWKQCKSKFLVPSILLYVIDKTIK